MKNTTIPEIISASLILLFAYTAASKLLDFEQFRLQMYNQTVPHDVATVLIWFVPGLEIITAILLGSPQTRLYGLYLSAVLISVFTGYIALVLLDYFGRTPCSCGGVIQSLGWKMHFVFNLFFLLLTALGIYFLNRERRISGKKK
jgi:putative oxidoreductase